MKKWILLAGLCWLIHAGCASNDGWAPAPGPLMTRWSRHVDPRSVHGEYPRPQMVRPEWLCLNGLWEWALLGDGAARPEAYQGRILVPFPIESALSGVMKRTGPDTRLWYRRLFEIPSSWGGKRVLLHFGAVDWEAYVWVDGKRVGGHRGGYDSFFFDITSALNPGEEHEITVAVSDPTDAGSQPRGKQVRKPRGIWYTPTTGIWRTVWLEPVPMEASIERVKTTPRIDSDLLDIDVFCRGKAEGFSLRARAFDGKRPVAEEAGDARDRIALPLKNPKLWSPSSPFLYGLEVELIEKGRVVDRITGYFGMRKIALGRDDKGVLRLFLNNEPLFQYGALDQGFWPDGLYTAPTDEALRYDIEVLKRLGFNMVRKHVKVEPDRWYMWCDRLGLLVWQDMPSGDRYIGHNDPDIERTTESARQFEAELTRLIDSLGSHPSIIMWVPFNEGWGQYDTARITDLVKERDPERLVNSTSGWADRGVGDVIDVHAYPDPAAPKNEKSRAAVLGEFGGLGLPVQGRTWQDEKNWGYRRFESRGELQAAYESLLRNLGPLIDSGLAAAVYTQTTDV